MAQSADMLFLSSICFLVVSGVSAADDQRDIRVKPGADVTLQCRIPRDASVILLEWNRSDLKSRGYIFFLRENRSYKSNQLPSFRGRAELRDPTMKDGDVSVILKNVTVDDSGTYECRVIISGRGDETTHSEIKHLIDLTVTVTDESVASESGHTAGKVRAEGNTAGNPAVLVGALVAVIGVLTGCFIVFKNREKLKTLLKRNNEYKPAGGGVAGQQV